MFGRESQMGSPVRAWLEQQGLQVKQEYLLPWGICDFVAVSLNASRVRRRLRFRQTRAIGPLSRVSILSHIPDVETGRSITLSRLEHLCGVPALKAHVERLIGDRFVVQTDTGSLQKLNGWVPLHRRIVAVEMKLSRVAEAIVQARSNCAFATDSFVAMPMEVALRIGCGERRSEFVKAGVGIIGVMTATCKVILRSSRNGIQPDGALQMHCVERFWRTRDNSTSTA